MSEWKTILSVRERNGEYEIKYDNQLDEVDGHHIIVSALYGLMKEFPELIEELFVASITSAEKLSEPFNKILDEYGK